MQEKFFNQFIDFLLDYLDEEILHDSEYAAVRKKCSDLSLTNRMTEYENAKGELDYIYRRLMCEKLIEVFKNVAADFLNELL